MATAIDPGAATVAEAVEAAVAAGAVAALLRARHSKGRHPGGRMEQWKLLLQMRVYPS